MSKNETVVAQLVKQVAIPKKASLMRLAGGGNARPSALCGPFAKPPLNWGTPPAANQQVLPGDEAIVIVTNDPLCSMIFTDKNPGAVGLQYVWLVGGSPDNATVALLSPGQKSTMDDDLYSSIPSGALGTRAFHGPRLYARKFKGRYYLWCDAPAAGLAGNNITVTTNAVPMAATDAVTVTIYRLNEYDEIQVFSARIPGPFAALTAITTFTLPTPDYYRVELQTDDDNTTAVLGFLINNNATCEIECHLALPDLTEREMNKVQGIRVFGAASHVMNLVSENFATGSWVGDQPEGGIAWTSYLRGAAGANGFQKLGGQQGNELMEFKKFNPYTFVTPEDDDDWKFVHPFTFNATSQVTNVLNRSMEEFHYTVVYLKSGGATALVADASRNAQMEFFFGAEYCTDGMWPQVGISPATVDDVSAAIKVLSSIENITHNPGFKEIMQTIGKYVRLSAPVLSLLGPYGKAAGLAAAGIGGAMGKLGYRTLQRAHPPSDVDEERQHKSRCVAPAVDMVD